MSLMLLPLILPAAVLCFFGYAFVKPWFLRRHQASPPENPN